VSANLTRAEEVVHERGQLWQAVRASLSLPGIFPPVYFDGDLLIDGGALDNVHAEVMRARVGLSGTRHRRASLGGEHVDLLLHPPVPAIGVLDFKAGAALIETGYRHAAEALAASGLPARFR